MNGHYSEDAITGIIVRAWRDPRFKQRLISDPAAAFSEAGIPVAEDAELRVLEDDANTRHIAIPWGGPATGELGDEQLRGVTAGGMFRDEEAGSPGARFT